MVAHHEAIPLLAVQDYAAAHAVEHPHEAGWRAAGQVDTAVRSAVRLRAAALRHAMAQACSRSEAVERADKTVVPPYVAERVGTRALTAVAARQNASLPHAAHRRGVLRLQACQRRSMMRAVRCL